MNVLNEVPKKVTSESDTAPTYDFYNDVSKFHLDALKVKNAMDRYIRIYVVLIRGGTDVKR